MYNNDTNQEVQQEIIRIAASTALVPVSSFELFREQLAAYIHTLINQHFPQLVQLLYRLDVSEKKLKTALANAAGNDAGLLIADLIIQRQLQKIETRRKYRSDNTNIPDDEKW
ncbi:hypothetical protein [Deminuibacter soli]|uniref:Uncharacterized protein n=1 Tax=Deminuibacter soli TaxID=2291815 RepID=A0A3E1NR82_9BACT|nr:hypothetical protein [Deminuibacter soli]RFM30435.1 hypothetical protein DXN05_05620 [Deminuibacter soli]